MSKLIWDQTGEREYETGIDHVAVYPMSNNVYPKAVAWNGVSALNENPSGGEANDIYADNIKYLTLMSAEKFGGTIEAFSSPKEFDECDGTAEVAPGVLIQQQTRKTFGLAYRSLVGNDSEGNDYGYKIHLIWGAKASPSERSRSTVNDSPEATSLSWEFNTTPPAMKAKDPVTNKVYKPTSHLIINSTRATAAKLTAFENILFGTDDTYEETEDSSFESGKKYYELVDGAYVETQDVTMDSEKTYYEKTATGTDGRLPSPDEVIAFFTSNN